MIRGAVQGDLLSRRGGSRGGVVGAVLVASVVFGLLHLVRFDGGAAGELVQVGYATIIGVMFGTLLVRTRRIWPLVVVHALIDLAAKLDRMGEPVAGRSEAMSVPDAALTLALVLPCLGYAALLLRRVPSRRA